MNTVNSTAHNILTTQFGWSILKNGLRYHWIKDRISQVQCNFLWACGEQNLAESFTKHHPPPTSGSNMKPITWYIPNNIVLLNYPKFVPDSSWRNWRRVVKVSWERSFFSFMFVYLKLSLKLTPVTASSRDYKKSLWRNLSIIMYIKYRNFFWCEHFSRLENYALTDCWEPIILFISAFGTVINRLSYTTWNHRCITACFLVQDQTSDYGQTIFDINYKSSNYLSLIINDQVLANLEKRDLALLFFMNFHLVYLCAVQILQKKTTSWNFYCKCANRLYDAQAYKYYFRLC